MASTSVAMPIDPLGLETQQKVDPLGVERPDPLGLDSFAPDPNFPGVKFLPPGAKVVKTPSLASLYPPPQQVGLLKPLVQVPRIENPQTGLEGFANSLVGGAESLTTPAFMALPGAVEAAPVLRPIVSGALAGLGAKGVGQALGTYAGTQNPTPGQTGQMIGDVAQGAAMTLPAVLGARVSASETAPAVPVEVPKPDPLAIETAQPEVVPPVPPQPPTPDETLQAKPQIPSPTPGQATPDIQIPQSGEAVRPVQPEGQQPQPEQEGQGLAAPAVPAASEPPLQTPAEPQSAEPLQPALTPAEQANAQRELLEAHAEPGGPTGIAQRVREKVAATGKEELPPSGEGISAADSVERGDSLLTADPTAADRAMTAFEKDPAKAISAEGMAVARARLRQLAQVANRAEETHGINSPEYEAAFRARSDWSARVKKMQTEWHASGMAQQGEQDIDTGTFTGLRSAYVEANPGKDFTPGQTKVAKGIATGVKAAADAATAAKDKLTEALKQDRSAAEQRAIDAANKTVREAAARGATAESKTRVTDAARGVSVEKIQRKAAEKAQEAANKVTREAAIRAAKAEVDARVNPEKKVWAKVQEYLDKGEDGFDDIRNKVATDLGMPVKKVTDLMTQNKRTKFLADDVWRKQEALRRFQSQAKRWLKNTSLPGYQRALAAIPRTLFAAKVGFHGTVALGTHAPMVAFQPPFWKTYIENFGKMYRMVGSPKYYEMQVQDLTRRQNYTTARRAGLVNDPTSYEDYNSPTVSQYFGRLSGMGNRGYSVLKILRQDMFDQNWNKLPKTLQTPEMASAISDGVNHATGVVKGMAPKGANVALFAPRLEASRAMWLAGDSLRAADTFVRWNKATEAEKHFAIQQVKEKAWVVGTLGALLAANQGMLSATSSDQKINFTDPMKGDFLNFKAAGMKASYGNPMLTMARLPLRLYEIRASDGGKLKNLVHPDEDTYKVLGEYLRSQASPFAGVIADQLFKADWQNRPLPNSERPVPKRLVAQGIGPYTWTEYLTRQALPIPAEEAAREVWRHMGMNEEQIKGARIAMAAASIAGSALTGGRLGEDTQSVSPMDKQRQQVAQKMFPGKDIASDLKARADVEEAIKREQPKAMEHKYADALPENVQKYLKNEKVAVPTTVEEVTVNRQRVPLNDAEQAYYDKLIVDRYTKYFNAVTQQADFRNSSRYDKQRQVDFETAGLRKDAREQLKAAIQDKKVPPL